MTAYGSIDSVKQALRLGAFDYITKPFEKENLIGVLEKAGKSLEGDLQSLPREVFEGESSGSYDFKGVIRHQTKTLERELIQGALAQTENNVTKAASLLGLSRKGLQLKLKELGIR